MKTVEETIICRHIANYHYSKRIKPFTLAYIEFNYHSDIEDKKFLDDIFSKGKELSQKVNPAAANQSAYSRNQQRILNNASAGILAEYCWKIYINNKAGREIVDFTPFTNASTQIDLIHLQNNKRIEVRSSFPRNGIVFSICSPYNEFDILGPYSNLVKPTEIQKDFYARTLYHIPANNSFLDLAKLDGFKVYLTGGATWQMMIDNSVSINKDLRPEDSISIVSEPQSTYRVTPYSRALDTIEIFNLITQ